LTDAIKELAKKNEVRVLSFEDYWNDVAFFWNYLDVNYYALENLMQPKIEGEVEEGVVIKGRVFVGKNTLVRSGVRIEGPAFIGEKCIIGPHSFIRPGSTIEEKCHIGSSEVKNSIIMSKSNAPHYTYVGDSVVCEDVNLGAGSTTANLRFNNASIFATDAKSGQKIDSGRRKLGCVIGAGTRVGINASINCGVAIGRKCHVYPHTFVKNDLPDETRYIGDFDKK
jgi:bifunctional UDP-N-acetylglucosamine pyrophosphorylase/glucosamine-1-phosphate N-acetyltransferase